MILISSLVLEVKDGTTVASTEIYGADKKTFVNIDSGSVFKLEWTSPELNDDAIERYDLIIKWYDITLNVYYTIFDASVGLVNEFYVNSDLLPNGLLEYMLSIFVVARSKKGNVITSNIVNPYIHKGSGTYVKVEDDYKQPIMKRAIAFTKVAPIAEATAANLAQQLTLTDADGLILQDSDENTLITPDFGTTVILKDSTGQTFMDENGEELFATATKLLASTNGWTVVQESYTKDAEGEWHTNDIKFEVLVDVNGEIITANDNEPIYVL